MTSSKNEPFGSLADQLPPATAYWVAYSGGVDSHVLLHVLATARDGLQAPLGAVHVDHGIQQQSGDWSLHARDVCAELSLSFEILAVDGNPLSGESPEAAARRARYAALAAWLPAGAVLMTAQHNDDQAETLLLQLFRGAGPRGLASMPASTPFGQGTLLRPLLSYRRREILGYAQRNRLRWVEDPSNQDTRYARNFVRQQLLPEIRQHWPGVDATLARAAGLQADQAQLSSALAEIDFAACADSRHGDRLPIEPLRHLTAARMRNLLRYWIERNEKALPAYRILERIRREMLSAKEDSRPLVHWPGAEVRRFRRQLFLLSPLPTLDSSARHAWNINKPLKLAAADGTLTATADRGQGLRVAAGADIEVRFRCGGEQLQPAGRSGHHALKKLFQEWAIPDWERARVPLIYIDGTLAAVAGLCVCEGFQADTGETGYCVEWSRLSG